MQPSMWLHSALADITGRSEEVFADSAEDVVQTVALIPRLGDASSIDLKTPVALTPSPAYLH